MATIHTVKKGETLGGIAKANGFKSFREIYDHPDNAAFKAKRPNPNLIFPGDVLVIPDKGPASGPAPSSEPRLEPGPELRRAGFTNFKIRQLLRTVVGGGPLGLSSPTTIFEIVEVETGKAAKFALHRGGRVAIPIPGVPFSVTLPGDFVQFSTATGVFDFRAFEGSATVVEGTKLPPTRKGPAPISEPNLLTIDSKVKTIPKVISISGGPTLGGGLLVGANALALGGGPFTLVTNPPPELVPRQ